MKTSRANVSRVRNLFRASPKKRPPAVPSASKTEAAKPVAPVASRSKAGFVRSFPTTSSPKEIVQKAKAAGIKLGTAYVYNVWTRDKAGAQKTKSVPKPPASKGKHANGVRPSPPAGGHTRVEILLKAVAAEVGLGRAIELLQSERDKVQSILKG
jgi:hypothetical protein